MKTFQTHLKSIRLREERRACERRPLTDRQLGIGGSLDRYLDARDELLRIIELLLDDLRAESPGLAVRRSFFDGRCCLTASVMEHWVDDRGCAARSFTRFTFLLSSYRPDGSLEVISKVTAGRDLPTQRMWRDVADSAALEDLREFVKHRILEGARAHFASRMRQPIALRRAATA